MLIPAGLLYGNCTAPPCNCTFRTVRPGLSPPRNWRNKSYASVTPGRPPRAHCHSECHSKVTPALRQPKSWGNPCHQASSCSPDSACHCFFRQGDIARRQFVTVHCFTVQPPATTPRPPPPDHPVRRQPSPPPARSPERPRPEGRTEGWTGERAVAWQSPGGMPMSMDNKMRF